MSELTLRPCAHTQTSLFPQELASLAYWCTLTLLGLGMGESVQRQSIPGVVRERSELEGNGVGV